MKLPQSILSLQIKGDKLSSFVKDEIPVIIPLYDVNDFISIWEQRRLDAISLKDKTQESRISKIIDFLEDNIHNELVIILWAGKKISVVSTKNFTSGCVI